MPAQDLSNMSLIPYPTVPLVVVCGARQRLTNRTAQSSSPRAIVQVARVHPHSHLQMLLLKYAHQTFLSWVIGKFRQTSNCSTLISETHPHCSLLHLMASRLQWLVLQTRTERFMPLSGLLLIALEAVIPYGEPG